MNPFEIPSIAKCPSCGRTNGVPTGGGSFDCMFCGARIDMARQPVEQPVERDTSVTAPTYFQTRDEALPLPGASYTTRSESSYDPGSGELVSYRWYNPRVWLELVGMILYTGFIVVIFGASFLRDFSSSSWIYILIIASLLFNGVVSVYRALATLMNTTKVRIQGDTLVAQHRPLPWAGARQTVDDIERFSIESRMTGSRRSRTERLDLVAVLKNGRKVTLVPSLKSRADGQAMIDALSSRLSLQA